MQDERICAILKQHSSRLDGLSWSIGTASDYFRRRLDRLQQETSLAAQEAGVAARNSALLLQRSDQQQVEQAAHGVRLQEIHSLLLQCIPQSVSRAGVPRDLAGVVAAVEEHAEEMSQEEKKALLAQLHESLLGTGEEETGVELVRRLSDSLDESALAAASSSATSAPPAAAADLAERAALSAADAASTGEPQGSWECGKCPRVTNYSAIVLSCIVHIRPRASAPALLVPPTVPLICVLQVMLTPERPPPSPPLLCLARHWSTVAPVRWH